MWKVSIIGFGFAGNSLHYRCLNKMRKLGWDKEIQSPVVAIDPVVSVQSSDDGVHIRREIECIAKSEQDSHIVHICTAPEDHLKHIEMVLEKGYRNIIVEKPVVTREADFHRLIELEKSYDSKILVVANWPNSTALVRVASILSGKKYGNVQSLLMVQNKSRMSRSISRKNEHVFDIEMPHQVVLAMIINGHAEVLSAEVGDMIVGDKSLSNMGFGNLKLLHANNVISELRSNLMHPVRERYVEIQTDSKFVIKAWFPACGDDSYSRLVVLSPDGKQIADELLFDDPLTQCLMRAYCFFTESRVDNKLVKPIGMDLSFNYYVVELLQKAKAVSCHRAENDDFSYWQSFSRTGAL